MKVNVKVNLIDLDLDSLNSLPMKIDVIGILGGGISEDGSIQGEASEYRAKAAIKLYNLLVTTNPKIKLYATGGVSDKKSKKNKEKHKITEAMGIKKYLVRNGIPKNIIDIDESAGSTWKNAEKIEEFMKRNGLKNIVIIGSERARKAVKYCFSDYKSKNYSVVYVFTKNDNCKFVRKQRIAYLHPWTFRIAKWIFR